MEQIVKLLIWPAVALIISLTFIALFRAQIAGLINRTRKLGKGGIETFEALPSQPSEEKKGVEEFFRSYDNPLILIAEQAIFNDLKSRKIEAIADREKILVRALAANNVILAFERISAVIWASQLECMRYLIPREQGSDETEIMKFYETARTKYPAHFENIAFERWLGFLLAFDMIAKRDLRYFITQAGKEFLKYLISIGKPDPIFG